MARTGETNGHTHQVNRGDTRTGPGGENDHRHSVESGAEQTGTTNAHTHSIPASVRLIIGALIAASCIMGCIADGVKSPISGLTHKVLDNSRTKQAVMNAANVAPMGRERFVQAINLGAE